MSIVEALEKKSTQERFKVICKIPDEWNSKFFQHHYGTGTNLIVNVSNNNKPIIGVSCHYDIFCSTAGANDNASAIAVCLDILQRCSSHSFKNFELIFFFFDEEETGLKGSKAYVSQYGTSRMKGLLNLEMVSMGNQNDLIK
jgi:Zn-dependent M28 family amino/carboxypeptidase